MAVIEKHKSSIVDLDANIVSIITYAGAAVVGFLGLARYGAWLVPFVIYLLEKKSKFVKKNSIQSVALNLSITVVYIALGIISSFAAPRWVIDNNSWLGGKYVGSLGLFNTINSIIIIVGILVAVVSIIAIIKSWNYEEYDIPLVSKYTDKVKKVIDKICGNKDEVIMEEAKQEDNSIK